MISDDNRSLNRTLLRRKDVAALMRSLPSTQSRIHP
jgi:hypothetical protein